MRPEEKGLLTRLVREPVREVAGWTWKLSAFASVISVALGQYHIALKTALLAVATNIIHNEAARSIQQSPSKT